MPIPSYVFCVVSYFCAAIHWLNQSSRWAGRLCCVWAVWVSAWPKSNVVTTKFLRRPSSKVPMKMIILMRVLVSMDLCIVGAWVIKEMSARTKVDLMFCFYNESSSLDVCASFFFSAVGILWINAFPPCTTCKKGRRRVVCFAVLKASLYFRYEGLLPSWRIQSSWIGLCNSGVLSKQRCDREGHRLNELWPFVGSLLLREGFPQFSLRDDAFHFLSKHLISLFWRVEPERDLEVFP